MGPAGALGVLVVDDDDPVRSVCAGMAESLGCRVHTAASVPDARALIAQNLFDVAFLDLRLPGGSGAELMEQLRTTNPRSYVIIMSASPSLSAAVDLMRNGANDFFSKPFPLDRVAKAIEQVNTHRQRSQSSRVLEDRLQTGLAAGRIVGNSPAMQKLFRIVAKVASTRHPVLITGEPGTGKEIVARAVHANGPFATSPFVPVDCDSLEDGRLEVELFGSEAPYATGIDGLLASAEEGTLYLAEIASLTQRLQSRLLRTLEHRQIRPAQGSGAIPFRGRLIASSSHNLELAVEQGRFRKDLFYRLNVVNLRVPPLRERMEDLPALVESFLQDHRREYKLDFIFSDHGWDSMHTYDWPGNIAELQALVARACAVSESSLLHFEDFSTQVKNFTNAQQVSPKMENSGQAPVLSLEQLERQAILQALQSLGGDKVQAARVLGIGKTTLYRKLKEYGIADDAS